VSAETNQKRKKKCERRISSSTSCSKLQGNNTPAVSYTYTRPENILTCTTRVEEREKNCVICLERVTATPGETHTHTQLSLSNGRNEEIVVCYFFLSFSLKSIRRWYGRKFRARNIGGKSYETCPTITANQTKEPSGS
jgi:hypothetical protein